MMIADRLRMLGHALPAVAEPAANYLSTTRAGTLLFVSGQIAQRDGRILAGRLGAECSLEDGRIAAEAAALNVIAQIAAATDGRLASVARVLKLSVFVASTPDFAEHSQVANGASDLFVEVFGEAGRHARAAIGVAALPRGASVEIEAVVMLAEARR
jgi:enamine deaminase RidA (YjgF/YER057c/UK114 family)